jgi:hypothetical protein
MGLKNIRAKIAILASYAAMIAVECVAAVNIKKTATITKKMKRIYLMEAYNESHKLLF